MQNPAKIALGVISSGKGREEKLDKMLTSIHEHVDAIYVTLTSPTNETESAENVCKKYNATISHYPSKYKVTAEDVAWLKEFMGWEPMVQEGDKLFIFDDARNYNLQQIPKEYDWYLWLDDDDFFMYPEKIRSVITQAVQSNVEAIYMNYIYQADIVDHHITHRVIEHLRERLVRNNDRYKWIAPIHETLIDQTTKQAANAPTKECEVLHLSTDTDKLNAISRNIKNLEYAILRSEGKDPRQCYYLAKALFDINTEENNKKAAALIGRYLLGNEKGEHVSGWAEERVQALEYLTDIYKRQGNNDKAFKAIMKGLFEPILPRAETFISISYMWLIRGFPDIAMFWIKVGLSIPEFDTTLVKNQKELQLRTLEILYNAGLQLGKIDDVWNAAQKLYEIAPNDPNIINAYKFALGLKEEKEMTKKLMDMATYLEQNGEGHKIKSLLQSAPGIVEKNPFFQDLNNRINPPHEWKDKSIAIYCGPGFTNWSPKKLEDPKGSFIGGSEEAVIRLGLELQKQGYFVTVFADPGSEEGIYDGVNYLPYYKFNKNDSFNIAIGWRQFLPEGLKAKKKYYWAHDLLNALDFTEDKLKEIDKVIVLSEFHRKTIPNVPDEKILISSNGI